MRRVIFYQNDKTYIYSKVVYYKVKNYYDELKTLLGHVYRPLEDIIIQLEPILPV